MSRRSKLRAWVVALVAALAVVVGGVGIAFADAGNVPDHFKNLESNGDGTYQLELTVKGDADTETETAADVNVLIVYDVSNSMTSNAGSTRNSRADQAEDIVHDFVANLRSYQSTTDPSNIEMALVTFARTGSIQQTGGQDWTSNLTDANGINRFFDDGGTDRTTNLTYTGNPSYGTNWQSALSNAQTLLDRADDDPTFVIFVTDGAPTASGNGNNAISPNSSLNQLRPFYEAGLPSARAIQTRENTTLYGIYAYGTEADLLDDLMYYANTGTERTIGEGTQTTDNYFTAADSAALTQAIESIFQEIVETLGVGAVSISDGTTSAVETTSGDIAHLLEVDDGSFEYWLSIPVANNQFTRVNPTTGEETTYTVQVNGDTCTVTGGASPITVTGSISGGQFKFKWEGATELSNDKTPPAASFNGTSVDWDLSSVGTLLDGVTYSVTFDVWPSQYTYDTIAEIQNGDKDYDDLDANEKNYLSEDGTLKTNTKAELTYTDTRTDDGEQTADYTDPDPVGLVAEQMSVHKDWENELDARKVGSIDMTVLMGDEEFHEVTLSDPGWSASPIYISTGLMRVKEDGTTQILDHGHDFTFAELGPEQYNWELVTPVIHPMLINGKLYTLILKEEGKFPSEDLPVVHVEGLEDEYEIDDKTYYIAGEGTVSLKAYNHRRSNLNLTKVVTPEDAPKNTTFPFTLTVNNSKKDSGSASDTNSDYYVWFSIDSDPSEEGFTPVTDAKVSGDGVVQQGNYWYAPSGTEITVEMQAGWNLRFTNLPTDTTYKFVEGDNIGSFQFVSAELTGGTDDTPFTTDGKTSEGTIDSTNKSYVVTYTNEYQTTDFTVTKVWQDNNDQDGLRADIDVVADHLALYPAPYSQTESGDYRLPNDSKVNDDGSYTFIWKNLPKYNDAGKIIVYWVEEDSLDQWLPGYTCEDRDAEDGGTITNVHTPAVTEASVKKVWDDANNQDGKRPTELKVTLSNGTEVILNDANDWSATVENLPKYASGEPITYTWTEGTLPEGYTLSKTEKDGTVTTLTNSYTPEVTEATVKKVWDDENNQDGIRPNSLEVTLSNGTKVTLNESNEWTAKVTGLPKYADGVEIEYTWTEEDVPTGYEVSYGEDGAEAAPNGGTITNTHTPSTIDIPVTKTWEDADNQDGKRPESITVNLLANGEKVQDATITPAEDGTWTYTFVGVPEYANGQKINYTVTEESVEGYDTTINGYSITNRHTPSVIDIDVEKKWEDADNQDGKRPESITVNLLANGEKVQDATITPAEDGTWTYTFVGVPEYANGQKINYTVTEESVEGYDPTITGYLIVNTHVPEKTSVTVTKTWDDADDQDGLRPGSVTVNLFANGEKVRSASITPAEDGTWSYTFTELPKYAAGTEIAYTVTEDAVDGYETTVDGFSITNKHTPEQTSITVTKQWDDADDKDGIRPTEITVTLLANGDEASTATLSEDNDWTYTWTGLYKYAEGKEIAYTVSEEQVEGYDKPEITGTATDGYTIKNHHTAKPDSVTIDPPVQKIVEGDPETPTTFTFQMEAITEGAPMPDDAEGGVKTVQITGTGSDEFGVVTYNKAGEWVYEITEIDDGEKFYTYDNTVYTLTVKVEEVPDGTQVKLIKTETVTGGDSGTAVFTNTYYKPEVGLEVTKTVTSKPANGNYYKKGETVTYEIVVTNTGEVDLTDVKVDDKLTGDHWIVDTLAAGASETFTTSYKVTKADVEAGSVLNVVTAEAENPVDPDNPLKDKDDKKVPTGDEKNPPHKKIVPQTGDDTPVDAMAIMTVFGAAALTAGTVLQRRKRK